MSISLCLSLSKKVLNNCLKKEAFKAWRISRKPASKSFCSVSVLKVIYKPKRIPKPGPWKLKVTKILGKLNIQQGLLKSVRWNLPFGLT